MELTERAVQWDRWLLRTELSDSESGPWQPRAWATAVFRLRRIGGSAIGPAMIADGAHDILCDIRNAFVRRDEAGMLPTGEWAGEDGEARFFAYLGGALQYAAIAWVRRHVWHGRRPTEVMEELSSRIQALEEEGRHAESASLHLERGSVRAEAGLTGSAEDDFRRALDVAVGLGDVETAQRAEAALSSLDSWPRQVERRRADHPDQAAGTPADALLANIEAGSAVDPDEGDSPCWRQRVGEVRGRLAVRAEDARRCVDPDEAAAVTQYLDGLLSGDWDVTDALPGRVRGRWHADACDGPHLAGSVDNDARDCRMAVHASGWRAICELWLEPACADYGSIEAAAWLREVVVSRIPKLAREPVLLRVVFDILRVHHERLMQTGDDGHLPDSASPAAAALTQAATASGGHPTDLRHQPDLDASLPDWFGLRLLGRRAFLRDLAYPGRFLVWEWALDTCFAPILPPPTFGVRPPGS